MDFLRPRMRFKDLRRLVSLLMLIAATRMPAQTAPNQKADAAKVDAAKSDVTTSKADAGKADVAKVSASPLVSIEAPPANFDVASRSKEVLNHLSAVIRYYRTEVAPVQTVGEPTDALYREQAIANTKLVASYAFQSGLAEAKLLAAYEKQKAGQGSSSGSQPAEGEAVKLQSALSDVGKRTADLKTQQAALNQQMQKAKPAEVPTLQLELEQIEGALQLNAAMSDALGKIVEMSDSQGQAGLAGAIQQLQHTAPELTDTKAKVVPAPLESLSAARSAGVTSQASVMFQLLKTRAALDQWIHDTDALHDQTLALRTPIVNILRSTISRGQDMSRLASAPAVPAAPAVAVKHGGGRGADSNAAVTAAKADAAQLLATRQSFESLTATFKILSAAAVPLSQEVITLEQGRANLAAWRAAVQVEYRGVLRNLLLRLAVISIALGILFGLGEVWRRATIRYVRDLRRRRQLLGMRRIVLGFLSGLVLVFGFVSQFNSLATFAGFITAGLAVGLQTILLSVAAYFFIIGRYGVRVGDRITVAGVTGDVIEVGLVRFYVLELAGTTSELQPTGRVAVFSNAILFQAGTPLYKQVPGTEYAWHEMTVKLQQSSDYGTASKLITATVQTIYDRYKDVIEQQHRNVQLGLDTSLDEPCVERRLLFSEVGLQLLVRFPVEIRDVSSVIEQVTRTVLELLDHNDVVKQAVLEAPVIRAAVKG